MRRSLTILIAFLVAGCGSDTPAIAPTATPAAARGPVSCDEAAYLPKHPAHAEEPTQNFYAPGVPDAPAPDTLDGMLTDDNALVVIYPAAAAKAEQDRLAKWASLQVATVVVPDKTLGVPSVLAKIGNAQLTCDGLDTTQLSAFGAKRGR